MKIAFVSIQYLGFGKRLRPIVLLCMALALLYGGFAPTVFRFEELVPNADSELTRQGPYTVIKVEKPRRNGYLFEDTSGSSNHFIGWEELRQPEWHSSNNTGFLWTYPHNKRREVWKVEINGHIVLTLDAARKIYSFDLSMEKWLGRIGVFLFLCFLLSIVKISKHDPNKFVN